MISTWTRRSARKDMPSSPHACIGGVVEGAERQFAGHPVLRNDQLVTAGADEIIGQTLGVADVAEADGLANGVAEAATRQISHLLAVAEDGFPAEQNDFGIVADEAGKLLCELAVRLLFHGLAPKKAPVALQLHGPAQPQIGRAHV